MAHPQPYEVLRMVRWLLIAGLLYSVAFFLLYHGYSGPVQTACWKLGHVTLGSYAGYWIDRAAFRDRIRSDTDPRLMIRRAIVMAAAMYTLGAGL